MKPADFIAIGQAIHRLSETEIGQTAFDYGLAVFIEEMIDILERDKYFDRRAFIAACALRERKD